MWGTNMFGSGMPAWFLSGGFLFWFLWLITSVELVVVLWLLINKLKK